MIPKKMSCALTALVALSLLCSCTPPYDRYMQEGEEFQKKTKYAQAKDSFHKAVYEARKMKDGDTKQLAAVLAEAEAVRATEDDEGTVQLWNDAISLAEKMKNYKKAARLRKDMGDLYVLAGNNREAEHCFKEGLKGLEAQGEEKSEIAGELLMALGDLKIAKKDNQRALQFMQKANTTLDGIEGRNLHLHADVLHKLSFIYQELNRENDAMDCEDRAKKLEMSGIGGRVQTLKSITER